MNTICSILIKNWVLAKYISGQNLLKLNGRQFEMRYDLNQESFDICLRFTH